MRRARDLALTGGLLCAAAALLAVPQLYVPGLAAVLAAVLAPAWVALGISGARVTLALGASGASEGERVPMRIGVERGAVVLPGATLTPWPGARERTLRRRREDIEVSLLTTRRGRQPVGPARMRLADPLGVCAREVRSPPVELLVLPRVFPIDAATVLLLEGRATARRRHSPEVDSLRPHIAGAPAARIHWPTVARTGELMERSPTSDPEPAALVVLDASSPESLDSLDAAVRATASLCAHLARRGGCSVLLPGDRRPGVLRGDGGSLLALLRRLALIEPASAPPPGIRWRPDGGFVLYVTAAGSHQTSAPAASGYRIGPHPLAGAGVSFTLAGCAAQPVEEPAWARSA
ncbi:MAG TPA: DUF58 domain-containing protein [Solirubrobacteraceae bacterium]